MLSLRMIIFAGIAGICLWGLFSLLDNLREPGLIRTAQGIAVKGCASLDEHPDAAKLCPAFLCQKALVDRKLARVEDRIEIAQDTGVGAQRTLTGRFVDDERRFTCLIAGVTVTKAEVTGATLDGRADADQAARPHSIQQ
jgi:hypothetical protein